MTQKMIDTCKDGLGCGPEVDWETMFNQSEKHCQEMYMKLVDAEKRADRADEELFRLRTIVSVVETMLGRKFEC